MRQSIAIFMLGLVGFCGCGDDDDDGGGGDRTRVRLDGEALAQESYSEINGDSASGYITDQDHFYATTPEDNNTSGGDDDDDLFPKDGECSGFDTPRIKASGDRMTIDFAFDLADCDGEDDSDRFFIGMYVELHCPGEDFSHLNGMTMEESESVMSDDMCSSSEKMGMKSNVHFHLKSVSEGKIYEIEGRTAETNHGETCYQYRKGDQMTVGDCQIVDYTKSYMGSEEHYNKPYKEDEAGWKRAEDSGPKITVATLEPKGLSFTEGDRFYSAGTFDVSVNGWKGALTYAGADVTPVFSLTKDVETIEGVFGEDDSWNAKSAKGKIVHSLESIHERAKVFHSFF